MTVAPRGTRVCPADPTTMMRLSLMTIVLSGATPAAPPSSGWSTVAPTMAVIFSAAVVAQGAVDTPKSAMVMTIPARPRRRRGQTPSGSAAMLAPRCFIDDQLRASSRLVEPGNLPQLDPINFVAKRSIHVERQQLLRHDDPGRCRAQQIGEQGILGSQHFPALGIGDRLHTLAP